MKQKKKKKKKEINKQKPFPCMRIGGQHLLVWASQVAQWLKKKKKKKKPSTNERDIRDTGSISGSRRSSGERHDNPL